MSVLFIFQHQVTTVESLQCGRKVRAANDSDEVSYNRQQAAAFNRLLDPRTKETWEMNCQEIGNVLLRT